MIKYSIYFAKITINLSEAVKKMKLAKNIVLIFFVLKIVFCVNFFKVNFFILINFFKVVIEYSLYEINEGL